MVDEISIAGAMAAFRLAGFAHICSLMVSTAAAASARDAASSQHFLICDEFHRLPDFMPQYAAAAYRAIPLYWLLPLYVSISLLLSR